MKRSEVKPFNGRFLVRKYGSCGIVTRREIVTSRAEADAVAERFDLENRALTRYMDDCLARAVGLSQ